VKPTLTKQQKPGAVDAVKQTEVTSASTTMTDTATDVKQEPPIKTSKSMSCFIAN